MRLKTLLVIVALAICVASAPATFAQNLLTNGSFETGDYTGWTEGGNFEFSQVVSGAFYDYSGAQQGTYYSTMGPVGSDGTLSQSFSDQMGQQYLVGFWFASVGDDPSDFSVKWDNTTLLSLTNPDTGANWTYYSYYVTGTGNDTLSFAFRDDPAYVALDNVIVSATIPEPSSLMLLGTGVLGLGGIVRRKLRR
ncbi:MAG: PEP-CTERM sorting domain-containing protein [Candidatus Korobacteraceae bacterium]|jgi:PEP-CTERM motif-containing protein